MSSVWTVLTTAWLSYLCFGKGLKVTAEIRTISPFIDYRTKVFSVGTSANLTCYDTRREHLIYTVWKLEMTAHTCRLTTDYLNGIFENECMDGKELRNGTNGETYLHIPHFTLRDQGTYRCDMAYWGGDYIAEIAVSVRVPPEIYSWLAELHNRMVAVCLAVGGNPAASISWRTTWNSTANNIITRNKNGTYTVESCMILPDHVSKGNLSCVISHPSWTGKLTELNFSDSKAVLVSASALQFGVLLFCSAVILFGILASCCILGRPSKQSSRRKRQFMCLLP